MLLVFGQIRIYTGREQPPAGRRVMPGESEGGSASGEAGVTRSKTGAQQVCHDRSGSSESVVDLTCARRSKAGRCS